MDCCNGGYHEFNLDWFLNKFKGLLKEWDAVNKEWKETIKYISDFIQNLDITDAVSKKLDEMLADGSLADIIESLVLDDLINNDCFANVQYDVRAAGYKTGGLLMPTSIYTYSVPPKANKSGNGALVTSDEKGNLIPLSLGENVIASIADVMFNLYHDTDDVIRLDNGIQIAWGKQNKTVNINEQNGQIWRNSDTAFTVGFTKSFSEQPIVYTSLEGPNDLILCGCRADTNGIRKARFWAASNVGELSVTVNYLAIGRWSA